MFLRYNALYWNFMKEDLWVKRFTVFPEKITSWACLLRSGLNVIFHLYVYSEILFKSLFAEKADVSSNVLSAKYFMFNIKLLGRSFMCIKKVMDLKQPALVSSQSEYLPLSKTLWYLLSRKLWKSVSKLLRLSETPIVSNLYIKPSCQANPVKSFRHIQKFVHYKPKLIYTWISFP